MKKGLRVGGLLVLVFALISTMLIGCAGDQTTSGTETASVSAGGETAGEETSAGVKDIKIGISFGTLENDRFQRESQIMQDYVADMEGVEVIVQSAQSDAGLQNSQIENLISQG
ncbi:MAG: hypothetical protein AAGU32_15205, partial [Bacillota bacterium]